MILLNLRDIPMKYRTALLSGVQRVVEGLSEMPEWGQDDVTDDKKLTIEIRAEK